MRLINRLQDNCTTSDASRQLSPLGAQWRSERERERERDLQLSGTGFATKIDQSCQLSITVAGEQHLWPEVFHVCTIRECVYDFLIQVCGKLILAKFATTLALDQEL